MKTITTSKGYSSLIKIKDYYERYNYLKIGGVIGEETFGSQRYLNQILYRSPEWKSVRNKVILRDKGMDMGFDGRPIEGRIIVHHMNPITKEDILKRDPKLFDMENLISVSNNTHEAIHYGSIELLPKEYVPRKPNDTCPWRCSNG